MAPPSLDFPFPTLPNFNANYSPNLVPTPHCIVQYPPELTKCKICLKCLHELTLGFTRACVNMKRVEGGGSLTPPQTTSCVSVWGEERLFQQISGLHILFVGCSTAVGRVKIGPWSIIFFFRVAFFRLANSSSEQAVHTRGGGSALCISHSCGSSQPLLTCTYYCIPANMRLLWKLRQEHFTLGCAIPLV